MKKITSEEMARMDILDMLRSIEVLADRVSPYANDGQRPIIDAITGLTNSLLLTFGDAQEKQQQ